MLEELLQTSKKYKQMKIKFSRILCWVAPGEVKGGLNLVQVLVTEKGGIQEPDRKVWQSSVNVLSDSTHLRSESRRPRLENGKHQRVLGGRILLDMGAGDRGDG